MARPIRALALMTLGGAIGALADPASGARRRHMLRDRSLAAVRRSGRRGSAAVRYTAGEIQGVAHRMRPGREPAPADDGTLADKVRSEAFRDLPITPREVNVGVVDGIVTLRGELASRATIDELVRQVRSVAGVRGVENLLHTADRPPHAAGLA